jgi:hypothetical protein
MKRILFVLLTLTLLTLACSSPLDSGQNGGQDSEPQDAPPQSEKRCGDSVCDGPENAELCPQDCPAGLIQAPDSQNVAEQSPATDGQADADSASGYRYISFSGAMRTTLNEEPMGDFTGTAFEYAGDYSVELWFPIQGGEVVQQRNTMMLSGFYDLYYGDPTCTPCEWTLDASAFEPLSFDLDASLTLEGIMEDGETVDELVYQLTAPPMKTLTGTAQCPCPGAVEGPITDPAAFPQLFTWFMQGITDPVKLNAISSSSVDLFPISPMGFISIPEQNMSYVIVPDLNTP